MKYIYLIALLSTTSCFKSRQEKKKPVNNLFYSKAVEFRDHGVTDSAYFYFNSAKDFFLGQKDSLGVGKCLLNMAIISTDQGDLFGGQELSINAIPFFNNADTNQHIYIKSNLNNLGVSNYLLKDYRRAINFYKASSKYTSDSIGLLTIDNNIANAYRRENNFKAALAIYHTILKRTLSQSELARTLSDFAYTRWLENKSYNPNDELQKTLSINKKIGSPYAQIANLVYLIDVNESTTPKLAFVYAQTMYKLATVTHNPNECLVSLQKLVSLSPGDQMKIYFTKYHFLSDSIQNARNAAKNQFALIRYESEKSKADNLKLQKENTERKYQVARRDLLIFLGIFLFLASSTTAFFWYRKRKEKMEADKKKAVSDSQLITSKKVHDVVANGLYRVIKEIEYGENIDKDDILDKLDDMYEKSRDISYDNHPLQQNTEKFHLKIDLLLNSFAKPGTQISIKGNSADFWAGITVRFRDEIEHILQELMVNMDKHSEATSVALHFERYGDRAGIIYTDNGIGIDGKVKIKNGLTNTGNRIQNIFGSITFDTNVERGLKISLSFPVS